MNSKGIPDQVRYDAFGIDPYGILPIPTFPKLGKEPSPIPVKGILNQVPRFRMAKKQTPYGILPIPAFPKLGKEPSPIPVKGILNQVPLFRMTKKQTFSRISNFRQRLKLKFRYFRVRKGKKDSVQKDT